MTEEVQDQEVQQSADLYDDGFEAGFAEARGDEPPTPEPQSEPEPEAKAEPVPEPEVQLTQAEIKAYLVQIDDLKSQLRTVHGRYGDLNSRLSQMQQPGAPREVTAEMFEDLNSEFPELAAGIAKGLSKLPMGSQAQAPVDLAPMEQRFNQELDRIQKQSELKLLSMRHRDWQTIRNSDDFRLWEGTLPEPERNELENSWDSLYIADQFDRFKTWRSKAQEVKQTKNKRLEAATTPRGVSSTPPTVNDDDAFMSGYKSIRRA